MKARVKETGEIIDVILYNRDGFAYIRDDGETVYEFHELEIIEEPHYWEKLLHQYAGMALQGLMADANNSLCEKLKNNEDAQNANEIVKEHRRIVASICVSYATVLIEKLQDEKNDGA